jgi:uncharacterized membrane protein
VQAVTNRTHRWLLMGVAVILVATVTGVVLLWPDADRLPAADEEPLDDLVDGEILSVVIEQGEDDEILGISGEFAVLEVLALDGPDEGQILELEINTDGFPPIEVGDRVAMDRSTGPEGEVTYFITDFQRLPTLLVLVGLFVLAVLAISRWHGLRSLIGLGLSLLIIVQFIVPAILAGSSPPLVALVGAVAVMIITLYLTHGINEMTTAAVVGTSASLGLTVLLGMLFVNRGRITGFASDDAVFARFQIEGLDLQGLVLAGLIIAALGVLDDVTISQSSTVFAIHDTDRTLSWASLFARAMRVGRDHIASVVNTLFLAYAGASIALLLLFSTSGLGAPEILNSEVLAEEIIKTVVGSLGLIAAVPLTTALAATVAVGRGPDAPAVGRRHVHGPVSGAAVPPAGAATSTGPVAGAASDHRTSDGDASAVDASADEALDDEALDDEERARRSWAAYLERTARDRGEPGPGDVSRGPEPTDR